MVTSPPIRYAEDTLNRLTGSNREMHKKKAPALPALNH